MRGEDAEGDVASWTGSVTSLVLFCEGV
jgi:hypothetical protein